MQNGGQHKKIKLNRIYKRCPRNQHLINTSRLLLVQIANYNEFQWTRNFSSLNHSLQLLLQWYATLGGKVKTRKCVAEVFEEKESIWLHSIAFFCLHSYVQHAYINRQQISHSFYHHCTYHLFVTQRQQHICAFSKAKNFATTMRNKALSHFLCLLFFYILFLLLVFFFSLQVNKCTTAVRIVIDPSELPMCDCSPDNDNPCGPESNCLNRMLQFECNPARCPAKEKCQNQRFQKREYADCEPLRTLHCGWGLRCKEG